VDAAVALAALDGCDPKLQKRALKSLLRTLSPNYFSAGIQLKLSTDKRISPALALSGWSWTE
jgi:hypothetical protein